MGLIENLLDKLLGSGRTIPPPRETIKHNWEQLRHEKTSRIEQCIREWLTRKLEVTGELPFTWSSSEGKTCLLFHGTTRQEQGQCSELETYIIDKLNIPEAGEFRLHGGGTIYMAGEQVKARFSSTLKALVDYNEDSDEEIYTEEELDEGDVVLFAR